MKRSLLMGMVAVVLVAALSLALTVLRLGSDASGAGQPTVSVDADATNGSGPCDPIDATANKNPGDPNTVAICITGMPGNDPDVAIGALSLGLTYDDALNECVEVPCPSGACLDDNPDINAGTTKWGDGLGGATDGDWTCKPTGAVEPACDINVAEGGPGSGETKMNCMAPNGPYTMGDTETDGVLAVIDFTVLANGTDTLTLKAINVTATDFTTWVRCNPGTAGTCANASVQKGPTPEAATETPTATATKTNTPTATSTPTEVPPTSTPTATNTAPPTATNTVVPTATSTPTEVPPTSTPTATNTPVATATNTPVPTATNTPVPTATNTPVPTATNTPVPTATNTPVPTATNTPVPTATNTPVPTATNTPVATATNTPVATATATATPVPPTNTATPVATATTTPTKTPTPAITTTPMREEGCSPGFWKNHLGAWVATGYMPNDSFEAVFGRDVFPGNPTLYETLKARGGGIYALGRQAVAALLNAAHPDVDPAPELNTPAEVIAAFQAGYDSGKIEKTKKMFEKSNESFCPLGGRATKLWSHGSKKRILE